MTEVGNEPVEQRELELLRRVIAAYPLARYSFKGREALFDADGAPPEE